MNFHPKLSSNVSSASFLKYQNISANVFLSPFSCLAAFGLGFAGVGDVILTTLPDMGCLLE